MTSKRRIKPPRRRGVIRGVARVGGRVAGEIQGWELIRPPPGMRTTEEMRRAGLDPNDFVVRRGEKPYSNLITDAGLDAWMTNTQLGWSLINNQTSSNRFRCRVGTGNAAPNVSDTTLANQAHTDAQSPVAVNSNPAPTISLDLPTSTLSTRVFEFAAGVATGTLAEVGITDTNTGSFVLFARELFRDGLGEPVTVAKASDEILRVTHAIRFFFMDPAFVEHDLLAQDIHGGTEDLKFYAFPCGGLTTGVSEVPLDRTFQANTLQAIQSDFYGGNPSIADIFRTAAGNVTQAAATSVDAGSYTPGSLTRVYTGTWSPSSFNGQVYGFSWGAVVNVNGKAWMFWLDEDDRSKLVKSSDDRLRFSVIKTLARHTP